MSKTAARPRSKAVLVFAIAAALSAGALSSDVARARTPTTIPFNDCLYAGQGYSNGACRGGQRCVTGKGDADYWQDDSSCVDISPGNGGKPRA